MMGDIDASLKWGKSTHPLLIRPGMPAADLKLEVQSLTGVPVGRQKLLCPKVWKGALKDDGVLPEKIATGKKAPVITLIGSAETLVEKSAEERPRFAEDMTEEELWRATNGKTEEEDDADLVDVVALQKEPGMERDDGKMEMYQYDRLVTGLPQGQINDKLVGRRKRTEQTADDVSTPLLGEVAMTLGMELRRAYINSLAVLPDGTLVSGLDDGHVQLWRRGKLVKDARHPTSKVDHVAAFPSSSAGDPSFVTAGDGVMCLWNDEGKHVAQIATPRGTTPASIAVGSLDDRVYLAACVRITRQVDPNQFRLVPQNEVERQRRDAAEAQERLIQNELSRQCRQVNVWCYRGNGSVTRDFIVSPLEDAPSFTTLLDIDGSSRMACGDAWGGLHIYERQQSAHVRRVSMQFRGSSIACMAQVKDDSLAVSIQPDQNARILRGATALDVTRPRGIYIVDSADASVKVVLDAHIDAVRCLCPLPDGSLMSAGGKMDATVRVWDIAADATNESDAGDEVIVLTEANVMKEPGYVFDLAVLPDSRRSGVYAIAAARYNVIKIVI
ncbi:hypothetical protein ACHAXT_003508 [Thalassiosira profunda]